MLASLRALAHVSRLEEAINAFKEEDISAVVCCMNGNPDMEKNLWGCQVLCNLSGTSSLRTAALNAGAVDLLCNLLGAPPTHPGSVRLGLGFSASVCTLALRPLSTWSVLYNGHPPMGLQYGEERRAWKHKEDGAVMGCVLWGVAQVLGYGWVSLASDGEQVGSDATG